MPFLPVRVLANIMMRMLANLMRAGVFSANEGDYDLVCYEGTC